MSDVLITPYFNENKNKLRESLNNLPEINVEKYLEKTVMETLEDLFGTQSAFKRKLPDPERFLINSVLAFAKAQGDLMLGKNVGLSREEIYHQKQNVSSDNNYSQQIVHDGIVILSTLILVFSKVGLGTTVGSLFLGLFGGLAESFVSHNKRKKKKSNTEIVTKNINADYKKISEDIIDAITMICRSFDEILKTFRTQIFNITNHEEPKFESQNGLLLQKIQYILGIASMTNPESPEDTKELIFICNQLANMLRNEGLTVIKTISPDLNELSYFKVTEKPGLKEPLLELPAILRENAVVLPGKASIPER